MQTTEIITGYLIIATSAAIATLTFSVLAGGLRKITKYLNS